MKRNVDEVGNVYGKLTVTAYAGSDRRDGRKWTCLCECKQEIVVFQYQLRRGSTRSCGCLRAEAARCRKNKHGHSWIGGRTREYATWNNMIQRCHNPNNTGYKDYGGRGISVCDRWRRSFAVFLEDMGRKPEGMTIDRIDNAGNYAPGNCRWATQKEQKRNFRRNLNITLNGITMCAADWAKKLGISEGTISDRLRAGRSVEDALFAGRLPRGGKT